MRTACGMTVRPMEVLFSLLTILLAAAQCQAAGVNETGVNSTDLQVVASQPMMVSCDAPSPLEKYDSYCEGLQADYFLLPKQRRTPSLTGLKPNVSTFVTSLNDTAAALSFKGVNALIAAKTYSFAVRYTGVLFFDIAGRYDFSLNSPAGTRLTINGNTVTFNQGSNTSTPTTGYNFAKAGYVPIELVFFNENSIPSLTVQWTGPADAGLMTVIEGSSIQFNCSHLQNNTNSVPAKTSSFCPGLSAVYYSSWANSSYATATGVATYAIYEQGLNHWSTTTTPYWSRLPASLKTSFSGRFHGQLWIPLPGTYTFKLQATRAATLFIGNNKVLNSSAVNGVAQAKTVTYTFATAGYTPVGLNFISRRAAPAQAGVLRLAWKGPSSPVFKPVYGFSHPCSTFVACSNSTTAGALPAEVVGTPPAGTTIESARAIKTASLATYIPNSNVTFTLGFPGLNAEDPSVEDVSYFVREAVANAAGLRLESVWTVPTLDDDGNVIFPLGAYFTSVPAAQRFYKLVNLRPQTIFSNSAGLYDFYPITVSSPDMGTRTAVAKPTVQSARPMATLASATGEDDNIPLPPSPLPTPTSTPIATNATVANTTTTGSSPSPTAAPTPTPTAAAPEATFPPLPTLPEAVPATPTPTTAAPAPAPVGEGTLVPVVVASPVAPVPAPEGTATPVPTDTVASTPVDTPAAPAPAPEGTQTPVPTSTAVSTPVAPAPAPEGTATPVPVDTIASTPVAPAPEGTATPVPVDTIASTPVAPAPAPEGTATPVPVNTIASTPVAPAPAPEGTATPVPVDTPDAPAPAPEGTQTPVPTSTAVATPVVPAPAPEQTQTPVPSDTGLATPVAPTPAPVPADLPPPVPTAMPTPMAPSPAPVAPEAPVPTPSATRPSVIGNPAPAIGDQTPVRTPSPISSSPRVTGPYATSLPSVPTPTAYGQVVAAQGPAPVPAPVPTATVSPVMAPSMAYSPRTTLVGAPTGGPQSMPPTQGPTEGPQSVSPTAGPISTPVSPSAPLAMTYLPRATPVRVPSPVEAPQSAPPTERSILGAPSGGPAPVGGPLYWAPTPNFTSSPSAYSPAPLLPVFVDPAPTSPSAYSPAPLLPPLPTPLATSPALTLPKDAFLVYAPPAPPTTASPIPTPYAYSPGTDSPGLGNSPSPGGYYPSPVLAPSSSPGGTLFGSPGSSPLFGSPITPGVSTPPSSRCAYGASTFFVPYPEGVGGYMVPCTRITSPGSPTSGYSTAPAPYGASTSPTLPRTPGYTTGSPTASSPVVSPLPAKQPVYYGLPVTCPLGAASCRPGPYAYYAPRGDRELTPAEELALLGRSPSPSVRSPSAPQPYLSPLFGAPRSPGAMALSPRGFFAPAPAPGPVVAPIAPTPGPAPGPAAQCACDPTDNTPRSVKLEVLSTAYNSSASDTIKFNAYLTFSHPTLSLNSSQVRVFTRQPSDDLSGTVTNPGVVSVLQPISQNCAFYSLKGYVSESNPFTVNSTSIFLAAGGNILDACGSPFNVTVTRVEQAHRLSGLLYATGVAYSEEAGALLDGNRLDLALAFTEPVPQLSANMFNVTGPPSMTSTELERVDGSDSYFTFSVNLPENYYGPVRVAMNRAGRRYLTSINPAAVAPSSLTLNRADPVTQGSLVNSTMTKARNL